MTDKDRDNFVEVLLALNGYRDDDENENSTKSSTKSSTDFEKACIFGGYGLQV